MRRKPCPAARTILAELACDLLEQRRARLIERRRPIPHHLAEQISAARLKAMSAGRNAVVWKAV